MADEKVVPIFGGPAVTKLADKPHVVDQGIIDLLEHLLGRARAGEVHAISISVICTDVQSVRHAPEYVDVSDAVTLLGLTSVQSYELGKFVSEGSPRRGGKR